MKILVIGSGGREHAVVKKLKNNDKINEIFVAPGNAGISVDAICVDISPTDIEEIVNFSIQNKIDLVIVTPDDPLVLGMVDELNKNGIRAFGPNKKAAQIEGSKIFAKNLMEKYGIKTADYMVFDDCKKAIDYLYSYEKYPVVIKADGLALGKGVIIADNFNMARETVNSIMKNNIFGDSGKKIVIEEFLRGVEVSVLTFTDGKTIKPMVSSMDHKKILEDDKGPNTGGMGVIAPNPYYNDSIAQKCVKDIFEKTIYALNKEGIKFKGVLYFGLMITNDDVYVIEYNCRFGDPETQVCLSLLKNDLLEVIDSIIDENLGNIDINIDNKSAICLIAASGGYPGSYEKGKIINGLNDYGQIDNCVVYHAGTINDNGLYRTNGGRVLGLTVISDTIKNARDKAYNLIKKINFEGMYYRKDIGKTALKALNINIY